ncbi:MAG: hypothetical protein AAF596_06405, partial [Planctomycetota bacterium]
LRASYAPDQASHRRKAAAVVLVLGSVLLGLLIKSCTVRPTSPSPRVEPPLIDHRFTADIPK